jgi:hypothetical protein
MSSEELLAEEPEEEILEKDWTGLCYTAALAWLQDCEDKDRVIVHGSVLSNDDRVTPSLFTSPAL